MTASSELRRLSLDDVAGGFALSSEAGWNQSAADWRFLLGNGDGIGIDEEGRLVATAIVLPLGGVIGWIAMVLVATSHRKRGFASRMMDWAVARCREQGLVPALDATPAGREVYRRLGFEDGPRFLRLGAPSGFGGDDPAIGQLDVSEILELDRAAFGVEREAVLRELAAQAPELALACRAGTRVRGYALGRVGRVAHEVGPIVAEDEATALALLGGACGRAKGAPVILDALESQRGFVERLLGAGWTEQRPYWRMSVGKLPEGVPARIFASAGPEYG